MRTSHRSSMGNPATLPALLRMLGVDREPLARQMQAVRAWLSDNITSPELDMSLRCNGYGLILRDERRAKSA